MKTALIAVTIILTISAIQSFADERVNGYYRSNGTYVQPYTRSSPDSSYNNNYSVQGNTNPYTGARGTDRPTWNDNTPQSNTNTYGNPGYSTPYNSGSTTGSTYRSRKY